MRGDDLFSLAKRIIHFPAGILPGADRIGYLRSVYCFRTIYAVIFVHIPIP